MSPIVTALITLFVSVLVLLALREVVCWYFKINQMVRLLERLADKLAPKDPDSSNRISEALSDWRDKK